MGDAALPPPPLENGHFLPKNGHFLPKNGLKMPFLGQKQCFWGSGGQFNTPPPYFAGARQKRNMCCRVRNLENG